MIHIEVLETLKSILQPQTDAIYVVGGTVRDQLLKKPIKDIDLIVPNHAYEIGQKIAVHFGGSIIRLFEEVETARVFLSESELIIDICCFREDDLEADLWARDFTINAMAIPLQKFPDLDAIFDPTGGRSDLNDGVVRVISEQNLIDDPLRMLRAVRFAADLNFTIDPLSEKWIQIHASSIIQSAAERIISELFHIFNQPNSHSYILKLDELHLLPTLLPECTALQDVDQNYYHHLNAWEHTLLAYQELEHIFTHLNEIFPDHANNIRTYLNGMLAAKRTRRQLLKLAILIHDIGKKKTQSIDEKGIIHFYGHEKGGEPMAKAIARRLRLSSAEENFLAMVVLHHLRPVYYSERNQPLSPRNLHRYFCNTNKYGIAILLHAIADIAATRGNVNWQERMDCLIERGKEMLAYYYNPPSSPPLVNGNDLLNHLDIEGSPLIGELLMQIAEEQAAGTLTSRKDALRFAEEWLKHRTNQNQTANPVDSVPD